MNHTFGAVGRSPIRLEVQVQPTAVVSPEVWDAFQRAVKQVAGAWGLEIAIGQDVSGSLEAAKRRYWEAMNRTGDVGPGAQDSTA